MVCETNLYMLKNLCRNGSFCFDSAHESVDSENMKNKASSPFTPSLISPCHYYRTSPPQTSKVNIVDATIIMIPRPIQDK